MGTKRCHISSWKTLFMCILFLLQYHGCSNIWFSFKYPNILNSYCNTNPHPNPNQKNDKIILKFKGIFSDCNNIFFDKSRTILTQNFQNISWFQYFIQSYVWLCALILLHRLVFFCLFVCLFNRSLCAETRLGPDGTRLEQNAQARLQKPI